jgi:dienelactone hydrolase
MNIFVTEHGVTRQVTHERDRDITWLTWFSEHRLGYLIDPEGDENHRLHAVNADGTGHLELTPREWPKVDTRPMEVAPKAGNRLLVAMGPALGLADFYWIDVETGAYDCKEPNPGNLRSLVPDAQGRCLVGLAVDGLDWSLVYRTREGLPFRALMTTRYPDIVFPVEVGQDGRTAEIITNRGRDTLARFEFNLTEGTLGQKLAEVEDSGADSPWGAELAAGMGLGPGPWAALAPARSDASGVQVEPVTYQARDGLAIPAFLHHPPGPRAKGRPAVVLCHGGPHVCVRDGSNPIAHLLASRGIVVLEPNFRGSGGLGKAFLAKGHGQWGRAMQDDLADGAHWLARMGHADPARVAIAGGSYGGYAALMGAVRDADVFCCAVALAGPADLPTFLGSLDPIHKPHYRLMAGDPETQAEQLMAVSPFHQAHRIRIPVLVIHGDRDARVAKSESDRMVAALRAQGRFVPYLVLEGEGHVHLREEARIQCFRAIENFFGLHLGSSVEAPAAIRLTP